MTRYAVSYTLIHREHGLHSPTFQEILYNYLEAWHAEKSSLVTSCYDCIESPSEESLMNSVFTCTRFYVK